jgi:hypothetical protein
MLPINEALMSGQHKSTRTACEGFVKQENLETFQSISGGAK